MLSALRTAPPARTSSRPAIRPQPRSGLRAGYTLLQFRCPAPCAGGYSPERTHRVTSHWCPTTHPHDPASTGCCWEPKAGPAWALAPHAKPGEPLAAARRASAVPLGAGAAELGGGTNGFGAAATGFGVRGTAGVAGATAAMSFLAVALAIAVLAVGLRAGDLAAWAFLAGALAIAFLAVGLRAREVAALAFLAGALATAFLAVGLRAGDLAGLALLAGALAGARFGAVLLADFFAADFFVVFFAAATFFFPFVAFFAMIDLLILAADFPMHTGTIKPD